MHCSETATTFTHGNLAQRQSLASARLGGGDGWAPPRARSRSLFAAVPVSVALPTPVAGPESLKAYRQDFSLLFKDIPPPFILLLSFEKPHSLSSITIVEPGSCWETFARPSSSCYRNLPPPFAGEVSHHGTTFIRGVKRRHLPHLWCLFVSRGCFQNS